MHIETQGHMLSEQEARQQEKAYGENNKKNIESVQ